jgi:hypothetical protein
VPESTPTEAPPTPDSFFLSVGRGEPRSAGYWRLWNGCAPDNNAAMAEANGGRAGGWIIMDYLLEDPGVLVGGLEVETCEQGLALLVMKDLDGADRSDDPAYRLSGQLLAAQLNLAAGVRYCPAVDEAVEAAQVLLLSLGFVARGEYGPALEFKQALPAVEFLTEQLASYNRGGLCR